MSMFRDVRSVHAPAPLAEALEPRQLLATFASVGLSYEPTTTSVRGSAYAVEGTINADGSGAVGDMYFADLNGRFTSPGLPYARLNKIADGRYQRDANAGFRGQPRESNGAQFLSADRFAAGWWYGDFADNSADVEFIVERSNNSTLADLSGSWRFSMISVNTNTNRYLNGSGTLTVSGATMTWSAERGATPYSTASITQTSADGRFVTAAREYLYLSADEKTLLFADMNRADGVVYVGVAVRVDTAVTAAALAGRGFHLSWLWSQNNGQPATIATSTQTHLELEPDGDYKIYNLDDWDSGIRDRPLERGFWSVNAGILRLDQDQSTDETRLAIFSGGLGLLMLSEGLSTSPDATAGLGSQMPYTPPPPTGPQHKLTVGALDVAGRPVVYELGNDGVWRVTDLLTKPGGPQLTSTPVSYVDPKDFKIYSVGTSAQGLILYTQGYDGAWSFRNLTTEITGAQGITSGLQVMTGADKNITITGLNTQGQVVRYFQDGTRLSNTIDYRLLFSNVSTTDLAPQGIATPAFAGPLVAYATSWGGLNIAGLDGQGNIWSVWWAPGLANWTASNLTQITGATRLAGSLTVYLTSWNGINIAGQDQNGQLQVAWWVPQFEGQWQQSNLTADTPGGATTIFRVGSVTSYVSSWDGLNIAGIDDATGETRVFWWSPARVNEGWAVSSLSAAIPGGSPAITRDTKGQVGIDQSLNVFGYNTAGQFIRYFWNAGGNWAAQNLTSIATPR